MSLPMREYCLRIIFVSFICLGMWVFESSKTVNAQSRLDVDVLKNAANWQIQNLGKKDTDWQHCVFYIGLWEFYEYTNDAAYYDILYEVGQVNDWKINMWRHFLYFWWPQKYADHQCVGQLFLDVYSTDPKDEYINDTRSIFSAFTSQKIREKNEWWWCDAVFMAAPILPKLFKTTKQSTYLQIMDEMFDETYDLLYSQEDSLFYRDESYIGKRGVHGEKVFWSRGNAWVLAGLVRILDELPDEYHRRDRYIDTYLEMAQKIAQLQSEDGFWRPSLLDSQSFPTRESSGTALFTYALAWGINNGVLELDDYEVVLKRAQHALASSIDVNGRVGWIQKPGSGPNSVTESDSYMYGVGAYLLAGIELNKLMLEHD